MLTRRQLLVGTLGVLPAARRAALEPLLHSRTSGSATDPPFLMPQGATDCHCHVFCDANAFPFAAGRQYTPERASVAELQRLHRALHIERVVIVQPSVYGTDNECTLAAIRQIGSQARGIAVIDDKTPDSELDRFDKSGIRGIRVNLQTTGQTDPAVGRQRFAAAVKRIGRRRWHIQMFAALSVIDALKDVFAASPVPLVFDHFGGAQGAAGVPQPGFDSLLSLVRSGKAYVKLSAPYRWSTQKPDYADMAPLAKALIDANPRRMLWGSDWPHPESSGRGPKSPAGLSLPIPVDDQAVLNQLAVWAPTAPLRRMILVENPAALYGW